MVRVAVIGVGGPWHHLPALSALPNASVVALCDIDEARLRDAARTFGVRDLYTDHRMMLDQVEADAVYVLPSVMMTAQIAAECLDRGFQIFLEKPPGLRATETAELAALASRRKAITMVGFNRRFHPLVSAARNAMQRHGPPSLIVAEWYKPLLMEDMGRMFPPAVLDRLLSVTTIHSIDLLRFLGGEVIGVQASGGSFYSPHLDAACALLRFTSGTLGVLASHYHSTKLERLQMHGRAISVELTGIGEPYREGRIFADGDWHRLPPAEGGRTDPDGFFEEDRHFIACVEAGTPVGPAGADLEDAIKTMELAEEIAAAAGREEVRS